jgi:hypothetical protein
MAVNSKIILITIILVLTFAALVWIRSDGLYDFDIRTALPFMGGRRGIGAYDWAGIALLAISLWGLGRLLRRSQPPDDERRWTRDDDYEIDDDVDSDVYGR